MQGDFLRGFEGGHGRGSFSGHLCPLDRIISARTFHPIGLTARARLDSIFLASSTVFLPGRLILHALRMTYDFSISLEFINYMKANSHLTLLE